jgi:predicted GNAT superfamily acetyltransferase
MIGSAPRAGAGLEEFRIRDLRSIEDYESCVALQQEIWGPDFRQTVPLPILKIAQRLGGVTAGAFDEHGELHGFVFGITGIENGEVVHWSDMLAVKLSSRGRGVGTAIKQHQYARCATLGVKRIYWTFDPLVARNAHINFNKLRVRAVEYVPQMYGERPHIARHLGLGTDRLVVAWPVAEPPDNTYAHLDAAPADAPAIEFSEAGEALIPAGAAAARIVVPGDIAAIQRSSAEQAAEWRERTRAAFTAALGSRWRVVGFERDQVDGGGSYILTRSRDSSPTER